MNENLQFSIASKTRHMALNGQNDKIFTVIKISRISSLPNHLAVAFEP